jgi:hypothetical protein
MWARFTPGEPLTVNTIFTVDGDPAIKYRVVLLLVFMDSNRPRQWTFITSDEYMVYPGTHYASTAFAIPSWAVLGKGHVIAFAIIVVDNTNVRLSGKNAVIYID